jgi:ADP-heptose:LPS heptosyltransferase
MGLFMPIKQESEKYIMSFLDSCGISKEDKLVALHPGASCPSKLWPAENFAYVGDKLTELFKVKIIIVCSSKDEEMGNRVIELMRYNPTSACGKTTVSELASLLKRCSLLISNDSGPVHIGVAVETPVIAIFGRNERGLSPRRWRPVGKRDIVLHKEVGCKFCLAHNCHLSFKCLKAITPEEVIEAAKKIL